MKRIYTATRLPGGLDNFSPSEAKAIRAFLRAQAVAQAPDPAEAVVQADDRPDRPRPGPGGPPWFAPGEPDPTHSERASWFAPGGADDRPRLSGPLKSRRPATATPGPPVAPRRPEPVRPSRDLSGFGRAGWFD